MTAPIRRLRLGSCPEIAAVRVLVPRQSRHGGALQDPLLLILEMAGGALVDVEISVNIRYGYAAAAVSDAGVAALRTGDRVEVSLVERPKLFSGG